MTDAWQPTPPPPPPAGWDQPSPDELEVEPEPEHKLHPDDEARELAKLDGDDGEPAVDEFGHGFGPEVAAR